MLSDQATQVLPTWIPAKRNVITVFEVTNALYFGATATTAYNDLVTYCQAAQRRGFKVVVLTVLPRSDAGTPGSFETDRQTVNTNLRANWTTFADALADVAADSRIGDAGDETNTTYYADRVHPTTTGGGIIAQIVYDAILTLWGI